MPRGVFLVSPCAAGPLTELGKAAARGIPVPEPPQPGSRPEELSPEEHPRVCHALVAAGWMPQPKQGELMGGIRLLHLHFASLVFVAAEAKYTMVWIFSKLKRVDQACMDFGEVPSLN